MRPAYRFISPAGLREKKRKGGKEQEQEQKGKREREDKTVLDSGNVSLLEVHLYTTVCDSPLEKVHRDITPNQTQQMPHATVSRR